MICTKFLKENFNDTYKDFSQKHEVITSCPLSLRLSGRDGKEVLTPYLLQNINLRFYTGIHITSTSKVAIKAGILNYDAKEKTFKESYSLHDADIESLQLCIEEIIYSELDFPEELGLRISWMSEIMMDLRTPTLHSAMTSLAAALLLISNKINQEDIQSIAKNAAISSEKIEQIKKLTERINYSFYKNKGVSATQALLGGSSPYLILEEINEKDSVQYETLRFDELDPNYTNVELDVAHIHAGIVSDVHEFHKLKKQEAEDNQREEDDISAIIKTVKTNIQKRTIEPKDIIKEKPSKKAIKDYTSYKIVMKLVSTFLKAGTKEAIYGQSMIIDELKKLAFFQDFNAPHQSQLDIFKNSLNSPKYAIIPDRNLHAQCSQFSVYSKMGKLRNSFKKRMESVREMFPEAFVYYKSWSDNSEPEGIKIEQNLFTSQKNSEEGNFIQILKYNNEEVQEYIYSIKDIHKIIKNSKLCLDNRDGKIYVNGEKLHSTHLKSQKLCTQLVQLMIESESRTVRSDKLPQGSYRDNVNTIKSKITIPFEEIAKDLGESINIDTSSSNDYFTSTISGSGSFILIKNSDQNYLQ